MKKKIMYRAEISFNGVYCDGCPFESDDDDLCLLFGKTISPECIQMKRNEGILECHSRCKQCIEKTK